MSKKKQKASASPISLDVQLTRSEAFIEKNLKKILIVLAAVVVVVAAIFIYRNYEDGQELKAQKAVAAAQLAFQQEQWQQALDGDGALKPGVLKVQQEYSGTKTANLCRLYAAVCYAQLGKTDEAIAQLEKYKSQDDQMVSPASSAALANCYIAKGQKEKGAEMLVSAAKSADNDAISPLCLLQAGQVYEDLGQKERALELYQQIKDKYFRSAISNQIDAYIERVK